MFTNEDKNDYSRLVAKREIFRRNVVDSRGRLSEIECCQLICDALRIVDRVVARNTGINLPVLRIRSWLSRYPLCIGALIFDFPNGQLNTAASMQLLTKVIDVKYSIDDKFSPVLVSNKCETCLTGSLIHITVDDLERAVFNSLQRWYEAEADV